MKKMLICLSMLLLMGVAPTFAQSAAIDNFCNQILNFLKVEGYVPSIDEEDKSVVFKKEGESFWIYVESEDPFYVEIHTTGYDLEEDVRGLLEACNYANGHIRCGKAVVGEKSLIFTIEIFCKSFEDFKNVFNDNLEALDGIKNKTAEYYNERHSE